MLIAAHHTMSSLLPISTYNLALEPFNPLPALEEDFPVTVRLTMAALDPEAVDDKEEPSTLRLLKKARFVDELSDDLDDEEEEEEDQEEEDELDELAEKEVEDEEEQEKAEDDDDEDGEDDDNEDGEDDEDSEDDLDDEIEEFVVCTLSPKTQFQQTLDFTISPDEEVYFVVTGSYSVHLSGNYVEHPADDDEDEYDSDDVDDEYYEDAEGDDYNLTPDEDELMNIDELEDSSDVERKIEELVEQEQAQKSKKRAAKDAEDAADAKKAKKDKSKKDKKDNKDEKKVQFTKDLEQGPTPSKEKKDKAAKKYTTQTLLGGVVTEDRKAGTGAAAKSGDKVGIRYIGKLKNGKVFDKNTSGKPFVFNLGKGECIKGFDLGVAGMAVGGERRVIIPAKMGYGSQALPGIPAHSDLTFDIKLVSLK